MESFPSLAGHIVRFILVVTLVVWVPDNVVAGQATATRPLLARTCLALGAGPKLRGSIRLRRVVTAATAGRTEPKMNGFVSVLSGLRPIRTREHRHVAARSGCLRYLRPRHVAVVGTFTSEHTTLKAVTHAGLRDFIIPRAALDVT